MVCPDHGHNAAQRASYFVPHIPFEAAPPGRSCRNLACPGQNRACCGAWSQPGSSAHAFVPTCRAPWIWGLLVCACTAAVISSAWFACTRLLQVPCARRTPGLCLYVKPSCCRAVGSVQACSCCPHSAARAVRCTTGWMLLHFLSLRGQRVGCTLQPTHCRLFASPARLFAVCVDV